MEDNIDEVRVSDFIMSLSNENDNDILELKKYAKEHNVPIIRDDAKDILKLLLELKKPKRILEIGTAIAYSTLVMHRALKDVEIITIEDYEERIKEAEKNIDRYNMKENVTLVAEDASVYLENVDKQKIEPFDFIFLDAAKGQYINWIDSLKNLLNSGGIILADNIFKDGEILESKFLIKKRDRTIHKRMREFLHVIAKDEDFKTYFFNIGDGVSISIKK